MGHSLLPNHPSRTTRDPLGLSDDDSNILNDQCPLFPILHKLFSKPCKNASQLASVIEDISYTAGEPVSDIALLKLCLDKQPAGVEDICTQIATLLQVLEEQFPNGELEILATNIPTTYTTQQLKCLTALQFLCVLDKPQWNDWGGVNLFSWYGGGDVNFTVKTSYIDLVLKYLTWPALSDNRMSFILAEETEFPDPTTLSTLMTPLTIIELTEEDDFPDVTYPRPNMHDIRIISSHRLVGHGPSATQEERMLASYPELLPVSLLTPPLTDNSALCISTTSPLLPLGRFKGHGRTARLQDLPNNLTVPATSKTSFLFMDAAELDAHPVEQGEILLPDFLPGMLERDFKKAFTGFRTSTTLKAGPHRVIATPWGAGAFGGDLRVKVLLLWLALSAASVERGVVEMVFLVKSGAFEERERGGLEDLRKVVEQRPRVGEVWNALMKTRDDPRGSEHVLASLVNNGAIASRLD